MLIIGHVASCSSMLLAFLLQFQSNCILYRDTIGLRTLQEVSITCDFLYSLKSRQKVQSLSIEGTCWGLRFGRTGGRIRLFSVTQVSQVKPEKVQDAMNDDHSRSAGRIERRGTDDEMQ